MGHTLSEVVTSYTPAEADAEWRLDPAAAAEAIGSGALLIDIRSDKGRAAGGIPETLRILRTDLPETFSAGSPRFRSDLADGKTPVILFCSTGSGSYPTAAALRENGFPHVTDLRGGFEAWRQAGLPAVDAAQS